MQFLPLLMSSAPALFQSFTGGKQLFDANKVKLQDTRSEAHKEELALRRQQAGSALMPGQKAAESQVQQNMANSAAALTQSGTGASGVLAGLSRLNQNTNQATNQLATQGAAFQNQAKDKLVGALRQDSAWRAQDLANYNREKAALKQAGITNLFGGLSTLGTVGNYAAAGLFDKDKKANDWQGLIGANTINQYGTGGTYDPNQAYPYPSLLAPLRMSRPGYFDGLPR
ncbi:MAG: hypothetical protein ACO1OQ_01115 [Rufibacter sp.]